MSGLKGVESVRLNLSTRRLRVGLAAGSTGDQVIPTVEGLGYDCRTFSAAEAGSALALVEQPIRMQAIISLPGRLAGGNWRLIADPATWAGRARGKGRS